jgi:hypothetical protein
MAMTMNSRMSRAMVMMLAIFEVATPRGSWVPLASSAAARPRADATDYLPENGDTARRRGEERSSDR